MIEPGAQCEGGVATYALFSVFLTAFVVALLALLGLPSIPTAEVRILETFLGTALAIAGNLAWPTWAACTLAWTASK